MTPNTLRLRLVVRRHALPDVRIVFPVRLDNDPTIANLLEQVNDVIPLESYESSWGLEDYAVELENGFELLHFQSVGEVLKEDEEVLYVTLQNLISLSSPLPPPFLLLFFFPSLCSLFEKVG